MPIGPNADDVKQTNEIKYAPKLLANIELNDIDVTSDALHTQTSFARYLVEERKAHYYFCVKGNQPTLFEDIEYYFNKVPGPADYEEETSLKHGRIEVRRIWTSSALNDYLRFPHVKQIYRIEKEVTDKKTGKTTTTIAYGITSRSSHEASPKTILRKVRGHWSIEVCHYIIDWIYDEDRSTIRTGYGPENMTRLRRFAIGLLKSKGETKITKKMRDLDKNIRTVLSYLKMTKNTWRRQTA